MNVMHNVSDRFERWIGPWEVEPFDLAALTAADAERTVIYDGQHVRERGKLSSWNERVAFVRFTPGDTAAACNPADLHFGVRSIGIDELVAMGRAQK